MLYESFIATEKSFAPPEFVRMDLATSLDSILWFIIITI